MRAIVTGSEGFVGRHLVARLELGGYEVVGVDRRAVECQGRRRVDLADPGQLTNIAAIVADADIVFHLAGRPGVRDSDPHIGALRRRDNVTATKNLLSVTPHHVPIVATSSSSVYGSAADGDGHIRPSREDQALAPTGGYARSKVEMEQACMTRSASGAAVAIVRPFTVVGEYQRPDMAFAQWLRAAREGRPIRLFGSPERRRDVTDVADVVEGLVRIAEVGYRGIVNLGTGRAHRIADLAALVAKTVGADVPVEVSPGSVEEVAVTLADTTRCTRVLGFTPATDVGAVVERMLAMPDALALAASS